MSRSYYKGNFQRANACESNKHDKQLANRKMRRRCKILVKFRGVDICIDRRSRAFSNRWSFGKEYMSWDEKAYTYTRRGRSK